MHAGAFADLVQAGNVDDVAGQGADPVDGDDTGPRRQLLLQALGRKHRLAGLELAYGHAVALGDQPGEHGRRELVGQHEDLVALPPGQAVGQHLKPP